LDIALKTPSDNSSLNIAERLRVERKRLGLTQEAFGRLGGVTKTAQSLFEAGKNRPGSEFLEALYLNGVDVCFIFTGKRHQCDRSDHYDWALIQNAFLFVLRTFAERKDRNFSTEQLFEIFKNVLEASIGVNRPDLIAAEKQSLEKVKE
jgi:transcriptional regulator with XRE-family HTH domain